MVKCSFKATSLRSLASLSKTVSQIQGSPSFSAGMRLRWGDKAAGENLRQCLKRSIIQIILFQCKCSNKIKINAKNSMVNKFWNCKCRQDHYYWFFLLSQAPVWLRAGGSRGVYLWASLLRTAKCVPSVVCGWRSPLSAVGMWARHAHHKKCLSRMLEHVTFFWDSVLGICHSKTPQAR